MVAAQKVVLTDRGLQALNPAPEGKRYIIWDAQQPHLGVRVTEKGAVSFIVVRRRPGQRDPDTHVLGRYPAVTLKQARDATPAILTLLTQGKRPREVEAERQREEERKRRDTFVSAIATFNEDKTLAGLRSGRGTEDTLRREFLGEKWKRVQRTTERDGELVTEWVKEWSEGPDQIWRKKPVNQITRRDVIERLDEIKKRGGKHAARHALGAIRKFFNWCAEGERFGIEISPCVNIRDKTLGISGRDLRRKRVLSDAELSDVWTAVEGLGYAPERWFTNAAGQYPA